jgi:hypothetical protein
MLRQWTSAGRARHVFRAAVRTYEIFTIRGHQYIYGRTTLTPTLLREMPLDIYSDFRARLRSNVHFECLTEQALEGGNGVTADDALTDWFADLWPIL